MFSNQLEEHLAHSAPCSSRWDGFDRGDDCQQERHQGSKVIGRMTSGGGYRVEIVELYDEDYSYFEVNVDGKRVHWADDRAQAVTVARWWMDGCPV
jgi:hypothetical protein